jgi:1-acyl-sn-glycerol-3-phosphate acyltransferase
MLNCADSSTSAKKRNSASLDSRSRETPNNLDWAFVKVAELVDRLEIPFNSLGVDPYGLSKSHLRTAIPIFTAFYRHYFSVRTRGIGHVPARGRAMLVGNHSGGIAIDAAMVVVSCLLEMDPPRLAQGMAEKFIARTPFMGSWTSRVGQLPGLPEQAERLLNDERLLLVFPEGARGTAKLFRDRYSLVDFGTGFMRLALKTNTPIVPFAVLGGGEAFPTVANAYRLGRLLGLPYFPIVAYGVPLPIPAKIEIDYGTPLRFSGTGNEDDDIVNRHVGKVKDAIAGMLASGATRRRGERSETDSVR